MIAVLWDDLRTGDIHLQTDADAFTVVWNASYYGGTDPARASATLYADGRIVLKYGEGNAQGGMIGVSAGDGLQYLISPRSHAGSMHLADDIVFEPADDIRATVHVPLTAVGAGPEIAVDVRSLLVPGMDIYVDYLPTEHVTDAVVLGLDAASNADGDGSWTSASHTISHTILLRKAGVKPFAPRYVWDETNLVHSLPAAPWMCLISLAEALDTEDSPHPLVWTTGPLETPWSTVAEVDGNGEDAAVSGLIGHGGQSWLAMSVTNSGTLTFNWRVSCQPRYDYLLLTVDGTAQGRLSGESGWLTKSVRIEGEGAHEVVWRYVKDGSVSGGQDRGWVDRVVWSPDPPLTLEEALDATNLVWNTFGDMPWQPVYTPSFDGEDAARSGAVGDYGVSILETTVTGPGRLQFFWQVSCEPYGDWLDFLVDGVLEGTLTGDSGYWALFSIDIGPGTHNLAWEYWKNEATAAGEDAGFLDSVVWLPTGSAPPPTHTSTTPVPVPFAWLDGYPSLMAAAGGDYEAAAWRANGKHDGAGNELAVWQDYVAGTCPTNTASRFRCSIEMWQGVPVLRWDPDLGNERVYTIWGRPSLLEGEWTTPTNAASRFFRVTVTMP
ncbi:MAG: hypothetical protein GX174_05605 [Lentisphaerae bacterium]|jgi:hypothetical protein|nr:hypothetical protein [Lentisphaerota bacterium]